MLKLLENKTWVRRLQDLDSDAVKNGFLSNYVAALMMLKLQDLKGLRLVNDASYSKLTRFGPNMSDLTMWGRALFYPTDPLVKTSLKYGHAELLAKEADRILDSRVQKLIKTVMTPPDQINWPEVVASLVLLKHRFSVTSSYLDKIGLAFQRWDKLSDGQRKKAVGDCFLYLMQSDPKSNLLSRMRELSDGSMLRDLSAIAMKYLSVKRLSEDGDGGGDGGDGTDAGSIGSVAGTMWGGNAIMTRGQKTTAKASAKQGGGNGGETLDQVLARMQKFNKLNPQQLGNMKLVKGLKRTHVRQRKFKAIKFRAPSLQRGY